MCKRGGGSKHTVCIPSPLVAWPPPVHTPLAPPPPRTLSGGALFPPPFTRGVCATPPLCANGECRAARKGTPPFLGPAQPNRTASATIAAASAPPCPCERGGEKAAPPFGRGPGEARKRRRMGGGAASRAPLPPFTCGGATQTLRAGCPSLHRFALPYAPQWGRAQPEGGTRSGGTKGKRRPSPIACEHDPACRPACTTREVVLTPPSLQRWRVPPTHPPLARAAPLPTSPS